MCFSIYAFLKINVVIGYVLKIDEVYRRNNKCSNFLMLKISVVQIIASGITLFKIK